MRDANSAVFQFPASANHVIIRPLASQFYHSVGGLLLGIRQLSIYRSTSLQMIEHLNENKYGPYLSFPYKFQPSQIKDERRKIQGLSSYRTKLSPH